MPTEPTTPVCLTVAEIADLYWVVARRVSHEAFPPITGVTARIADGIYLTCSMDYPKAQINAVPGTLLHIDVSGVDVTIRPGDDGYTYYDAKVYGLPICWLTRQGTGPSIVGGGQ